MRITTIPAQITTVEDKIAGDLNLTQVIILLAAVFWAGIVYILFIPAITLTAFKISLVVPVFIISFILSLRIKGVLAANWLLIIFKYFTRPKYYVFDKNDSFLRTIDLPTPEKQKELSIKETSLEKENLVSQPVFEEFVFEKIKSNFSIRANKKGGLDALLDQFEK
jgi:hypothetical protein